MNELVVFVFVAVILLTLGFSILSCRDGFRGRPFYAALNRSGVTLMTMVGVLGTFTGIFIGLLGFDEGQIDESISRLLEGLKVAFFTSIVGLASATVFGFVKGLLSPKEEATTEDPVDEVLAALRRIEENASQTSATLLGDFRDFAKIMPRTTKAAVMELKESTSESAATMLSDFREFARTMPRQTVAALRDIKDGADQAIGRLISEFQEFAQTMAKDNSAALMDALQEVIRDFNTKLNEQFGDNFKQLNAAVGALLTWQENYREHVERLESRMTAAVEAVETVGKAVKDVPAHLQRIPDLLAPLDDLLTGMSASVTTLEQHLDSLATLRDKAVEAIPVIENNLRRATTEISSAVSDAIAGMSASVEEQSRALAQLRAGYSDLSAKAEESGRTLSQATTVVLEQMQRVTDSTEAVVVKIVRGLNQSGDAQRKTLEQLKSGYDELRDGYEALHHQNRDIWAAVRDTIDDVLAKTDDEIKKRLDRFDVQMQNELGEVLTVMGRHLAALSKEFVDDYRPLTIRLQKIVRIAERIRLLEATNDER